MTGSAAPRDLVQTRQVDRLVVRVFQNRASLGAAAAAPSQEEFLAALAVAPGIDWSRVTAFQLDDYVGLPDDAAQRFGTFLRSRLFDAVRPGYVRLVSAIDSMAEATAECRRYAALIDVAPLDIVCLGIGENGHLAFNDPPVAKFDDPERVKLVELDGPCRRQQVNDGCCPTLEQVPTHAITLTIPTLLSGRRLVCVVPGRAKRDAVNRTLTGPIATLCPASILRTHPACTLYVDTDSHDG